MGKLHRLRRRAVRKLLRELGLSDAGLKVETTKAEARKAFWMAHVNDPRRRPNPRQSAAGRRESFVAEIQAIEDAHFIKVLNEAIEKLSVEGTAQGE